MTGCGTKALKRKLLTALLNGDKAKSGAVSPLRAPVAPACSRA
jgi:hypothetical protein